MAYDSKARSEAMRKVWQDAKFRNKMAKVYKGKKWREGASKGWFHGKPWNKGLTSLTSKRVASVGDKIKASWKKFPERRRLGLIKRSKNPSWAASRVRSGQAAAAALHGKHKGSFEGAKKIIGEKTRQRWADPKYRARVIRSMRKVVKERRESGGYKEMSKIMKQRYKEGRITGLELGHHQFPVSKIELRVFNAIKRKFRGAVHQYKVPQTRYTGDIFIPSCRLIVEVDAHLSHQRPEMKTRRRCRDKRLKDLGYQMLHLGQPAMKRGMGFCVSRVRGAMSRYGS